jgi:hypothetical protein
MDHGVAQGCFAAGIVDQYRKPIGVARRIPSDADLRLWSAPGRTDLRDAYDCGYDGS